MTRRGPRSTRFACPLVAGVDEVGRGPLAGPVTAAAVILPARPLLRGLADSKTLTAAMRELLDRAIRRRALAWCIAEASVEEIDRINILQASLLAMERAVAGLRPAALAAWVDGNRPPSLAMPVRAVVDGDNRIPAISAASIIAKVARDRRMTALDALYPGYGLARHKGYGTAEHLAALSRHGVTPIHRRSFAPVARVALSGQQTLSFGAADAR